MTIAASVACGSRPSTGASSTGSALLGYLNADHWALAVPIARAHRWLGSTLIDQNDFPREALLEAVLRMVEEDQAAAGRPS